MNDSQLLHAILTKHAASLQADPLIRFKKLVWVRFFTENLLSFLIQYTGLLFSTLILTYSPIWLASGTACAFIFLRGATILPGIGLGSFLAFYTGYGASFLISFLYASLLTLQAYLLLRLTYKWVAPSLLFSHHADLFKFVFINALISSLLLFMPSIHTAPLDWLACFNGILIIGCAITSFDAYFPQINRLADVNKAPLFILFSTYVLLILSLFFLTNPQSITGICLCLFLLTIAIGIRYGWCGLNVALFLLGFLLSLGAYLATPFFAHPGISSISLSIFIALTALMGLLICLNAHEW